MGSKTEEMAITLGLMFQVVKDMESRLATVEKQLRCGARGHSWVDGAGECCPDCGLLYPEPPTPDPS